MILNLIKLKGFRRIQKRNINIRSFFAPNHIYDENTLKALKNSNIKIIIDGYGLFPFYKNEILFIPSFFIKKFFCHSVFSQLRCILMSGMRSHLKNSKNLLKKINKKL